MRMTRRAIAEIKTYRVLKKVDIMFKTQEWLAQLLSKLCRKRSTELLLIE